MFLSYLLTGFIKNAYFNHLCSFLVDFFIYLNCNFKISSILYFLSSSLFNNCVKSTLLMTSLTLSDLSIKLHKIYF